MFLKQRLNVDAMRFHFKQNWQLLKPILSFGTHDALVFIHPTLILGLKNLRNSHLVELPLQFCQPLIGYLCKFFAVNLSPLSFLDRENIQLPLSLSLLNFILNPNVEVVILALEPCGNFRLFLLLPYCSLSAEKSINFFILLLLPLHSFLGQ